MIEQIRSRSLQKQLVIAAIAAIIFLTGIISPPHLMDDVDSTQAEIAKTMLRTGDWVTARLDGLVYLEKAPFKFWLTAIAYRVLGVHDWVARLPNAIAVILLALLVYRVARWAGNEKTGFYAGLVLSTSIGLFLFTRIVIPDVILTLAIAVAVTAFMRATEEEQHSLPWACLMFAAAAIAVLLKGLIGIVFPAGICLLYLVLTSQLMCTYTWRRLHLLPGLLLFLLIAAPWHILAILRNPPYFDFTLHADPHFGYQFHGFFWFYFINEHLLRFTNGRWPHDYNTVPRLWFWLYHIIWFFPWSFFLIALRRRQFGIGNRLGRLHLLCLLWIGVVMVFFTLSTTQEYYSMPIYPALALLIGSAMTSEWRGVNIASRVAAGITCLVFLVLTTILIRVRNLPTPGDISDALTNNPQAYTLSLGHMSDLTFAAFAYLRTPLLMAASAFLIGTVALWALKDVRRYLGVALMLALFLQAARVALVTFDPYLSSHRFADALNRLPRGTLICSGVYYNFSAIPFYAGYQMLILNGRYYNLEYGSYAPGAPQIFLTDTDFTHIWREHTRAYIVTSEEDRKHLETLVGASNMYPLLKTGGRALMSNQKP